jgi:hypothetical protein
MEQAYDEVEDSPQDDTLDLTGDLSDTEFTSQEIKPFQVAALLQEVDEIAQEYPALQPDEVPLPA